MLRHMQAIVGAFLMKYFDQFDVRGDAPITFIHNASTSQPDTARAVKLGGFARPRARLANSEFT